MSQTTQPAALVDSVEMVEEREQTKSTVMTDLTTSYLKSIGGMRLLSREEEIALAMSMEKGKEAAKKLESLCLGAEKKATLEAEYRLGELARQRFVESNLRLVVAIARRLIGRGLPIEDLIQEGNIGLLSAVEKFDYRKGCRFSTYATWWIRQTIARAIIEQGRTIRLPVYVSEVVSRASRVNEYLEQKLGRECSAKELAEAAGVPEDTLAAAWRALQQPVSLETPVGENEEGILGELVEDERVIEPNIAAVRTILADEVRKLLSELGDRERELLILRFGLRSDDSLSLSEIGARLGVTRERVRQIEEKALAKLLRLGEEKGLRDYLAN